MKKIIEAGIKEARGLAPVPMWAHYVLESMLKEAEKSSDNQMNIHTRIQHLEKLILDQNRKINVLEEKAGSYNLKPAVKCELALLKSDIQKIHQTIGELSVKGNTVKVDEWKPKQGELFYFITSSMYVMCSRNEGFPVDVERINSGNCFRTKEQAEQALERVKRAIRGDL